MDIVDPSQPFTYASGQVPPTYKCGACGKRGVKLWRDYPLPKLLRCADCSAREQEIDISDMQPNGDYTGDDGKPTNMIKWLIPALLEQSNKGFWSSQKDQPSAAVKWWQQLPLR